jgi:hypothetical protein
LVADGEAKIWILEGWEWNEDPYVDSDIFLPVVEDAYRFVG